MTLGTFNFALLIALNLLSPKELTIELNLTDVKEGTMIYVDAENKIDSALLKDGVAAFKIQKTSIVPLLVKIYNKSFTFKSGVYVDNHDVKITGSFFNPKALKYEGSQTQDETLLYTSMVTPFKTELNRMRTKGASKKQIDSVNNIIHVLEVDYMNKHKNSYVSLYLPFIAFQNRAISSANAITLLSLLKETPYQEERTKLIDIIKHTLLLKNGDMAPEFALTDLISNKVVALSDFKNKVIVLNFWASWCGPCIGELPVLKEFASSVQNNPDIVFLSVSLDEYKTALSSCIAQHQLSFPVLSDYKGASSDIVLKYGVSALPETFIISKQGTISRIEITTAKNLTYAIQQISLK